VTSRVIEVTPNVSGQEIAIPVMPNQPVKAGTILLRIDPTPFQSRVDQLQAGLAQDKIANAGTEGELRAGKRKRGSSPLIATYTISIPATPPPARRGASLVGSPTLLKRAS
jgi:multidrug resistance efflux pump